jgi:hypothetical protein
MVLLEPFNPQTTMDAPVGPGRPPLLALVGLLRNLGSLGSANVFGFLQGLGLFQGAGSQEAKRSSGFKPANSEV